jgi:hypothetical protein
VRALVPADLPLEFPPAEGAETSRLPAHVLPPMGFGLRRFAALS